MIDENAEFERMRDVLGLDPEFDDFDDLDEFEESIPSSPISQPPKPE